jgi:hypothetical protein
LAAGSRRELEKGFLYDETLALSSCANNACRLDRHNLLCNDSTIRPKLVGATTTVSRGSARVSWCLAQDPGDEEERITVVRRAKRAADMLVPLFVLIGAVLSPTGCSSGSAPIAEVTPTPIPTPIVPVKPTYRVQFGEVVDIVQFTGRIAPVVEQELLFRSPGYVGAVYAGRDDWVFLSKQSSDGG